MTVTETRVFKTKGDTSLKAFANVTFDQMFVIRGIKVIEGRNGKFIAFPDRKDKKGEYKDICHPINSECRKIIQDAVLKAYEEA